MIQAHALTKYYGEHPAIRSITFEARHGEILGFLGPNGAGKTTTMRILTGYMPPSEGHATVAGFDVVEDSIEVRRRVGYLPETVPLYPELSVFEYLTFMGSLRRVPALEDRIDEVLEEVHLTERSESYIGNLSKGLRQRLGLAQALLHRPDVLILDEPTIGLDPAQIIEVRKLIQGLGRERTILLSTHILSEAQQVCDRVVIINKGVIVAEDTPANLQSQLAGAERILVRVADGDAALRQKLEGVSGVVRVAPGQTTGELEIASSPGVDVRARVARAVVEAGHDLLELRPIGVSLEDVFLQLTTDDVVAEAGG
ncbi:MAG TPA: ABC transporter ATP-binding protein [Anaerolineales bacterium]|nr:ABC transporter ATP-binding protein [Anaerolineales bacterium]